MLIVDDEPRRYARLIGEMEKMGVRRDFIDLVPSASDARAKMEENRYDIFILDILVSQWPDSDPDVQNSLNLLLELHEGDEFHKPSRILGITADLTVAKESEAQFSKWTWSILNYSSTSDEWMSQALNCVRYVIDAKKQSDQEKPGFGTDLVVICALEKPELEEVLKLPWNWGSSRPVDDLTFVRDGTFESEGRTISVSVAFAPRMGMVSTALLSANLINLLRPRLIAMCGICAGVRGKTDIGDILLADPAWDFQSGKRVKDKESYVFSFAPHQLSAPSVLRRHVEQIRSDTAAMANLSAEFSDSAPRIPKVLIGPVASGSAVLADGKVIEDIKAQHRELLGVEMEVYGLYAAAASASSPQPLAFALKSVCDFADPDKGDNSQRFAAYTSARVLRILMERFGARLLER